MTESESVDPVRHILATFNIHEVNALLMGGQACILYGAAELSKDVDFAVLADSNNLARLRSALEALDAEVIAVPAFEKRWLDAGLAIHFRCRASQAEGFRINVMTRMRGVDDFAVLWERRNVVDLEPDLPVPVMALRANAVYARRWAAAMCSYSQLCAGTHGCFSRPPDSAYAPHA